MGTEAARVCGFMVVRRPHENYDVLGRGVFPARPAMFGATYYGGVDRMPWFDLDELYYEANPPKDVVAFKARLGGLNSDATGIALVRELTDVSCCLRLMGGMAATNEVIAVHSQALAQAKGWEPVASMGDYLGLDIVPHGEGSLVREGIFGSDFFGPEWGGRLNAQGLFSTRAECESYWEAYRRGVEQGRLEAIGPNMVDFIEVYRISVAHLFQKAETVKGGMGSM
jgi:hypothetical protein